MIGLAAHERDLALVVGAREAALADAEHLVAAVERSLCAVGAPKPLEATCVFARWKPGRALALAFEVAFDDGVRRVVVAKTHASSKRESAPPYELDAGGLRPWAFDERSGAFLSVFPHDRELPGLPRALDPRRVARRIDELGLYSPLRMRPGPSRLVTLRYKPERRAVLRLDLRLRERDDSPRVARQLIARVLPPLEAQRCAERRRTFDAASVAPLAPRFIDLEERTGILLEEHLAVESVRAGDFAHARECGALLAELHRVPVREDLPSSEPARLELDEWSAVAPWLARCAASELRASRRAWRHGDLHADQFARSADGAWRVLDLDLLDVGDPSEDLATWIADEVAAAPVEPVDDECGVALLEGYRAAGGVEPDERELALRVAHSLTRLAVGALRRLERGALERSMELARRAERFAARAGRGISVAQHWIVERIDPAPTGGGRVLTELSVDSVRARRRWRREERGECVELDPGADTALALGAALREPKKLGVASLELLAYRPGRRLTLRGVRADGSSAIFKGYRRSRARDAELRARAASQLSTSATGVRIPRVLALHAEWAALELEDLGGRALELRTLAPARLERFGAALRRFGDSACFDEAARHGHDDELAVCRTHLARTAELGHEPRGAAGLLSALDGASAEVPRPVWAACHRDLHDGQLLDLGDALGWIDFDLACTADSALDAANFVAHLALRRLQGCGPRDESHEHALAAAFARGLARSTEPGFERRAAFYRAATYLRLALVYALRPQFASAPDEQLELARRALEEFRRA